MIDHAISHTSANAQAPSPDIQTVGVIGLGTIGASWASFYLSRGLCVRCYDPAPGGESAARQGIASAWRALERIASIPQVEEAMERLSFHRDAAEASQGADFIQESAPERLEIKRELLTQIERGVAPDVVIASSTSGLMPSDMQAGMVRPDRFLIGHPFNPPHLMPLVEIVGGKLTAPSAVETAMKFYAGHGKRPIHILKETPGHVANRLQAALWREAVHLALEGVASVADIDAAVVAGPGARWAVMGPHLTLHLAGGDGGITHFIDHLGPAFEGWWADLGQPRLNDETTRVLADGIADAVQQQSVRELADARDDRLLTLLTAIRPLS